MGLGTAESLVVFVLSIVPGVFVLELIELGRPRLRERDTSGTLARYFLLSAAAWGLGIVVFDVDGRLSTLVRLNRSASDQLVDGYLELAGVLLISAVAVGLTLRLALWAARKGGYRLATTQGASEGLPARLLGSIASALASPPHAWDALLARLRESGVPQVAEVRLRDGGKIYGVLAGGGQADYEADGRGLLLDAELVEVDGALTTVSNSSGVSSPPMRCLRSASSALLSNRPPSGS